MDSPLKLLPPLAYGIDRECFFSLRKGEIVDFSSNWLHQKLLKPLSNMVCIVERKHYIEIVRNFPISRGRALSSAISIEAMSLSKLYGGCVLHYAMCNNGRSTVYFFIINDACLKGINTRVLIPESLLCFVGNTSQTAIKGKGTDDFVCYWDEKGIARSMLSSDMLANPALKEVHDQAAEQAEVQGEG